MSVARLDQLCDEIRQGRISVARAMEEVEGTDDFSNDELQAFVEKLTEEKNPLLFFDLLQVCIAAAEGVDDWLAASIAGIGASHLTFESAFEPAARLFQYAIFRFHEQPPAFAVDLVDQYLFCLLHLGRTSDIIKFAPEHVRRTEAAGRRSEALRARAMYALALGRSGLLELAKTESELAWQQYETEHDTVDLRKAAVLVLSARAETARVDSRFGEALSAYGDLELYHRANGNVLGVAYAMSEIGMTWERLGDRERRDLMFTQAADLARSVGATTDAERWMRRSDEIPQFPTERTPANLISYVGRLLMTEKGEFDVMRRICLDVIEEAKQRNILELEGMARNTLGAVYDQFGKYGQSRAAMNAAIEVYRRVGDRAFELQVRTNMLRALLRALRIEEAIAYGLDTLRMAQAWRASARSAEARQSMGVALSVLYGHLVTVCSAGWAPAAAEASETDRRGIEPSPEKLLAIGQASKAINMVGWLWLFEAAQTDTNAQSMAAAIALRAAETRLERAAANGANVVHAFDELEHERDRLLATSKLPQTSLINQREFSIGQIAACLPPASAMLELLCCPTGIACALIPVHEAPRAILIPWGEAERAAFVRQWLGSMRTERWKLENQWRSPMGLDDAFQFDEPPPTLSDLVVQFRKAFLGPLASFLRGTPMDRLVIVPQDELYLLPMTLLEDDETTGAVSIMPSTAAIPICFGRSRPNTGLRYKIGDATQTLRFAGTELALLSDYRNVEPSLQGVLESLQHANRLHFAGHGVFENKQPYDSGLVLRDRDPRPLPDISSGPAARLTIATLLSEVSLTCCNLVVLSGCCTGQSRMHKANEFTSLPGAFLVAGATHVVASLWPAHDGACAVFMRELYRELNDHAPDKALARARASLRGMSYSAAVEFLGERNVPAKERPFESPIFSHAFQHYGVPEKGVSNELAR